MTPPKRHLNVPEPVLAHLLEEIDEDYLRPNPANIREANRRATRLITEVHNGHEPIFSVEDVLDHGSLSRGTALRNFNDLDKIVILDAAALRTQRGHRRTPTDAIARLAAVIRERRAGLISLGQMSVRRQGHSVGIEYPQTGFRIDLVPGLRARGRIRIPERDTNKWIPTYSDEVASRLREASAIQPNTVATVRLLKGWARARGNRAPLPSFAIETLVVDSILRGPMAIDLVIEHFFEVIAGADARRSLVLGSRRSATTPVTCIDPVSRDNLTADLTRPQQSTLIRTARRASKQMKRIRALLAKGEQTQALALARDSFVGRVWR